MCGRFVGFSDLEQLKEFFPIDTAACDIAASYNVAPSQEVFAIVNREGENWLEKFHWGLVPFWAKDISIGNKMILIQLISHARLLPQVPVNPSAKFITECL